MDFENPVQIPTSFSYRDFKNAFAAVENMPIIKKKNLFLSWMISILCGIRTRD
jgi:hypothetical protein